MDPISNLGEFITLRCDLGHIRMLYSRLLSYLPHDEGGLMSLYNATVHLQTVLEKQGKKVRKSNGEVLFRHGEKAFGLFLVLNGKVRLDIGVDSPLARSHGAGALVGLPATLTGRNYSMTATVVDEAELVFWPVAELHSLLQRDPEICKELLATLAERLAEDRKLTESAALQDLKTAR